MRDLRIVFMGTPEFAVASLEELVKNNFNIVAVITAPDKPQGRGRKPAPSPVKECAQKHGLDILQPTNLKDPEFLETLKSYNANLQIVVAFRMLPESVWSMPEYGTFNLHASLLPQYRGAAPINWAIINGEKETGVTTFLLKHEIDTGNILFQEKESISDEDTVGDLYARLMNKGAKLVVKTTEEIQNENEKPVPQDTSGTEIKHAPKIFKETCEVNWGNKAEDIYNFIRGLSPYPAAWTTINDKNFKLFKTSKTGKKASGVPGDIETDNKSFLYINCGDELLQIDELQAAGKKRMTTEELLRGFNF
ncbi:methionyl-tRNA formyltransferase [Marinigracilibium pacificum]|uniref:Methionyl-tRNA formyltransferase n=1 Tax=Marinigracilibium pacificum TaxID=2729599 RepID=A0A848J0A9_9BACT|nr:methionyl-tRNA formyltransferase [Marinigracilibium pacificum]NMM50223.1 methionyl-tRNA formyltransferase [Marinigracilibium pacificum]